MAASTVKQSLAMALSLHVLVAFFVETRGDKALQAQAQAQAEAQVAGSQVWCVAKPAADEGLLQKSLNFACGEGGADCVPIQAGGPCFSPSSFVAHASYAYNSYFNRKGRNFWNCYFENSALLVVTDPSFGSCTYPAM